MPEKGETFDHTQHKEDTSFTHTPFGLDGNGFVGNDDVSEYHHPL